LYSEAIEIYQKCIELDEYNVLLNSVMHYKIAMCNLKLQNNESAIISFNYSLDLNETNFDTIMERGNTYMMINEYSKAREDFTFAL